MSWKLQAPFLSVDFNSCPSRLTPVLLLTFPFQQAQPAPQNLLSNSEPAWAPAPTPAPTASSQALQTAPSSTEANMPTMSTRGSAAETPNNAAAAAAATSLPTQATPHGAPTRQYLNEKVIPVLMAGMKLLALQK